MPRWRADQEEERSSRGPQTERPVYRRDTRYVSTSLSGWSRVARRGWVERGNHHLWASVQRQLFWGPHQRTRACAGLLGAGARELVTKESRREVEQPSQLLPAW
jgi:hypothetical protein